jgi:uncharacterized membrane protein
MYSKVKIAGHPLHPMLVGFPVALYVVTFACFLAYALGAGPFWFRSGVYANLAAVILAAVAALPGFVDWAFGIPAGTPAKSTGLTHMVLNVVSLLVFLVNVLLAWSRRLEIAPRVGWTVVLPIVGVLVTVVAGFLGWKLVQTHHVGVDLTPEQQRFEPRPAPRVEQPGRTPQVHGPQGAG